TKPSNMGSGVGISKSDNQEELRVSLELAFKYDIRELLEQVVTAREIEVGLLGNADVKSSLPGEVVKDVAFYDYHAKYIDNKITMALPAQLPEGVVNTMRQNAE
ncbi:D-alanine--D-alanine ligase, partial [Streptococcus gordonii]|nr:D-alanine--D-alanine ligase [Streptococcus gordonii]